MSRFAPRARFATLAVATAAAVAVAPAAAQAAGTSGCPEVPMVHPFLTWGDSASYVLAPDGGFEGGGTAWTLAGGASVGEGNETFQVGGAADHASLTMPARSSAVSAPMCIGVEHRSMRFFVKGSGAKRKSSVKVDVLYANRAGKLRVRHIGRIRAGADWSASPSLALVVNRLAARRGNALQVSFRFTSKGAGVSIDDVYVDPWRSH